MTFFEALLLVAPPWIFVVILTSVVAKNTATVQRFIDARERATPAISLTPADDPMVHDYHSDNDEYQSVTARAQAAWKEAS